MKQRIFLKDINTNNDLPEFQQVDLNNEFVKYLAAAECIKQGASDVETSNQILKEVLEKFRKYTVGPKYVEKRKAALITKDWFTNANSAELKFPEIFSNFYENVNGLEINHKMKYYEKFVLEYLHKYIINESDEIINVSSTGVMSPNPVQKFVSNKGWDTGISNCLFNDCYASIIALKSAGGMLYNPNTPHIKDVNIIHSELQSIHIDANDLSAENLVVMSLFGDGFVNYHVTKEADTGLELIYIKEKLIPESSEQMQWHIGERIFQMSLSIMVPYLLNENIEPFINELAEESGIEKKELIENSVWAIHPGGPKIIEMVAIKLNLQPDQTKYSYEVLKENGNITSATLPFIWEKIIKDDNIPKGKRIVSLAFGPGLTACAMISEKL